MSQLTEEQTAEFLRMPVPLPDMLRAVYAAGQASCLSMLLGELDAVLAQPGGKALRQSKQFTHIRRAMQKARAHLEKTR